jgi:hypothetical protein
MIFDVNKTEYEKLSKCSNNQHKIYHAALQNRFFEST